MIDWNIRLSDIIILVSVGATFITYAFRSGRFAETISIMERDVRELKDAFKILATAMTSMAVQRTQIERIEKDIDDMKRGRGFIQDRDQKRHAVDGEY